MAEGPYTGTIGFSASSFGPDNKTSVLVNLLVTSQPIASLPQQTLLLSRRARIPPKQTRRFTSTTLVWAA